MLVPLLIVGAIGLGGFFGISTIRELLFGAAEINPDLVFDTVKRGPFVVAVTERGSVGSMKNSTLSSKVEGSTTIIFIVPEGTSVKAPVVSTVSGVVSDVVISGENRSIVVESHRIVVNTPWFFLPLEGVQVEHPATLGKYTRVLVEPGDVVQVGDYLAGDVVCELDSSIPVEKEKTQQIAVKQAGSNLQKARSDVEIQFNLNLSDLATATLALDLARLDLRKFVEGERIQEENEAKGEVLIAQEDMTQADEKYQYNKRLAKKGFKTQIEVETSRINLVKARNTLAVAKEKLKLLQNYAFERKYKELKETAEEAGRELKRTKLKGLAAVAQFQAELGAKLLTFSVEIEKLKRLERQIKASTLVAPQDGKVVYANQKSRRSQEVVIEEGVSVHERQRIINLPDFSQMKVEAKVHEAKISNVGVGMRVRIRIDAVPDHVFIGQVMSVPDVPVRGEWPNTDLMLYETMIRITGDVSKLKPGMNAIVEIIAQERDDVLQVPVQVIIAVGDSYVAYVRSDTSQGAELRRNVKIGASTNTMIEVLSGLEEGEQVVMNPLTIFGREIADLRAQASQQEAKDNAREAGKRKLTTSKRKGQTKGKGKKRKRSGGRKRDPMAFFRSMDKNKDGSLTKDELPERMQQGFSRMDANADGKIDSAEWQKIAAARSRRGGGKR